MFNFRFLFIFFNCLIYSELRNILKYLKLIRSIIRDYNIFKLIIFFFNKNVNPYSSKDLEKLLNTNKNYWEKKRKENNSDGILVECFINQQLANMSNMLLCKYLEKIYKTTSSAIIRKYDFKTEVILKSFQIDKIYKYEFGGVFNRIKYIYLSSKIISKLKTTKDLYNFKLQEIDLGLTVYDTWIRYSKIPSTDKININMVYILANALHTKEYFERIIKNNKIKHLVQAEKQFVPLSIFFQVALKKNVKVYARDGFSKFTVRIFSNFKERNYTKIKFSSLALKKVLVSFGKNKINKMLNEYYNFLKKNNLYGKSWANAVQNKSEIKLWENKIDGDESLSKNNVTLSNKSLKIYYKDEISKKFQWDKNKKIISIFFPYLIDGIYQNGRRNLYIDNYRWILNTLKEAKKIDKYNWILKEHPQEIRYQTKTDLDQVVSKITQNYPHIKKVPLDVNPKSIINFTDLAIVCNGTTALEYQAFGKKVLIAENSYYNHFGFKKIPQNIKEYIKVLNNLEKIKLPTNSEILKAKTFLLTQIKLSKTNCNMMPNSKPNYESRMNKRDENMFWKDFTSNLKKNKIKNDPFFKMFDCQIKSKNQHTFNFNQFFSKKIKIRDLL